MRGHSILSAIVITLSLLVLSSNSVYAVSTAELHSLFTSGQKSEDTSYSVALTSYESLNTLLINLDSLERQSLTFKTIDGRSITASAFVDSFLPLARRKAVAENDIFECALLLAERISDTTDPPGVDSRASSIEFITSMTAEKCLLNWSMKARLVPRPGVDNIQDHAYAYNAVSAYQCGSDSACVLIDSAIQLSLSSLGFEDLVEDNLAEKLLQAMVACGLEEEYPNLIQRWTELQMRVDTLTIRYYAGLDRDWERLLAETHLHWGQVEQAREHAFRSTDSTHLLNLGEFVITLCTRLLDAGDTASALELLLDKSEIAGQSAEGYFSREARKFAIPELRAIGAHKEADRLFQLVEDDFREQRTGRDTRIFHIYEMADFYSYTGARESARRMLDSIYVLTPIDTLHNTAVSQLLYSYLTLCEYNQVRSILSAYPSGRDRDNWITNMVRASAASSYPLFIEELIGFIADSRLRDRTWADYISARGSGQEVDYVAALICQIEDPAIYLDAATALLERWPMLASYAFASDWPWTATSEFGTMATFNAWKVIFRRADEFAVSPANEWYDRAWFRARFKTFLDLGDFVHAKQSLDYERGLPVFESSQTGDSIDSENLSTLAENYAVIGELQTAKEVLGGLLGSIALHDYSGTKYYHDYDLSNVAVAYARIGATDLALKTCHGFETSSGLAEGLAKIAIAYRTLGNTITLEDKKLLHELLKSRLN